MYRALGGMGGEDSVSITKAENGYFVTLSPRCDMGDMLGAPYIMERPEPHQIESMKKEHEKSRPKVFVYHSLDDAWAAVKEFLMDGRIPQVH
jgi:hypothetical protein